MPARSSSLAPASSEPLSRVSVCRRAGGSSHKHGGSSPWTGRLLFSPLGQQQEAALACLAAEQGEVREARLPSRSPVQAQIRRRFSPPKKSFFRPAGPCPAVRWKRLWRQNAAAAHKCH